MSFNLAEAEKYFHKAKRDKCLLLVAMQNDFIAPEGSAFIAELHKKESEIKFLINEYVAVDNYILHAQMTNNKFIIDKYLQQRNLCLQNSWGSEMAWKSDYIDATYEFTYNDNYEHHHLFLEIIAFCEANQIKELEMIGVDLNNLFTTFREYATLQGHFTIQVNEALTFSLQLPKK